MGLLYARTKRWRVGPEELGQLSNKIENLCPRLHQIFSSHEPVVTFIKHQVHHSLLKGKKAFVLELK